MSCLTESSTTIVVYKKKGMPFRLIIVSLLHIIMCKYLPTYQVQQVEASHLEWGKSPPWHFSPMSLLKRDKGSKRCDIANHQPYVSPTRLSFPNKGLSNPAAWHELPGRSRGHPRPAFLLFFSFWHSMKASSFIFCFCMFSTLMFWATGQTNPLSQKVQNCNCVSFCLALYAARHRIYGGVCIMQTRKLTHLTRTAL